jgi:hypothetical protein
MIEMLVSTAIGGIVLMGIMDLYVATSKSTLDQTGVVEMQMQAKAAMDYMVRDMQLMYGSPTISTTLTANDTITFLRLVDSGYSSGGNLNSTLNDTKKNWKANAFAPSGATSYAIRIIDGTGAGQSLTIAGNTATQLTIQGAVWGTIPDATSLYLITLNKAFTRTSDNMLRFSAGNGPYMLLADSITSLSFSQPDPNSISISETVRSQNKDPFTQNYFYYTLTDTVQKRN